MIEIGRYKRVPQELKPLKPTAMDILFSIGLGAWVATSLFAMFWITDDFDSERNSLGIAIGLPCIVVAIIADLWYRQAWLRLKNTRYLVWFTIFGAFAWGNLCLLNALGASGGVVVSRNYGETAMTEPQYLGAFGMLFKKHW